MYTEVELFEDCERIASRFSKIKAIEIAEIWEVVCRYIENQLKNGKASSLIGLGKFTFQIKKIDGGTMGIKEQRFPVFVINESFVRLHGLRCSKQYVGSEIPVVEVNYFLIAQRASTIKEVIVSVLKIIYNRIGEVMGSGKQVAVQFRNIGKLTSDRKIVDFSMEKDFQEPVELRYFELSKKTPVSSTRENGSMRPESSETERIVSNHKEESVFRVISEQDKKLLLADKKSSLMRKRRTKRLVTAGQPKFDGDDDAGALSSRQFSRGNSSLSLTPINPIRNSPSCNDLNIIRTLSTLPSPLPHRLSSPADSFDHAQSPSSEKSCTSSLALTVQNNSFSNRTPLQANLDAVMMEAFNRHEQEMKQRLLEQEVEKQQEENQRTWNSNAEKQMKQMRRIIEKGNQKILLKQIEVEKLKRNSENNLQKEFKASDTSLRTSERDLNIENSNNSKDIAKNSQRTIRQELHRQISERLKYEEALRRRDLEQESKLIEKSKQEYELERTLQRQKKKKRASELQAAWTDQLYMARDRVNPRLVNWTTKAPSSVSGVSSSWHDGDNVSVSSDLSLASLTSSSNF